MNIFNDKLDEAIEIENSIDFSLERRSAQIGSEDDGQIGGVHVVLLRKGSDDGEEVRDGAEDASVEQRQGGDQRFDIRHALAASSSGIAAAKIGFFGGDGHGEHVSRNERLRQVAEVGLEHGSQVVGFHEGVAGDGLVEGLAAIEGREQRLDGGGAAGQAKEPWFAAVLQQGGAKAVDGVGDAHLVTESEGVGQWAAEDHGVACQPSGGDGDAFLP